jgi:hypothetical protein
MSCSSIRGAKLWKLLALPKFPQFPVTPVFRIGWGFIEKIPKKIPGFCHNRLQKAYSGLVSE